MSLFCSLAGHATPAQQIISVRTSNFNKATINFYHRAQIFVTNRNTIALSFQFSSVCSNSVAFALVMTHIKLVVAACVCLEKSDCIVKIEFNMLCTPNTISRLCRLSHTDISCCLSSGYSFAFFLVNFRKCFIFLVHWSVVIAKWM